MSSENVGAVTRSVKSLSKMLIASYTLDWIAMIALGLIGLGFSKITPNYHAFSVLDLSLSYPSVQESISIKDLVLASVFAPAMLMIVVVIFFVPGPNAMKRMSRGSMLRWKLWEFNVAWLGLALSQVTEVLIVQGVKNAVGKPRPHMLAICQPDIDNIAKYAVGGYGQDISPRWILVDQRACRQTNHDRLATIFQSFPSGHAAASWGGLLYLTLWLCAKFSITFPAPGFRRPFQQKKTSENILEDRRVLYQDEAAAAPAWLLFLAYIPIGVAIYITTTRWVEYFHHGLDVIVGSLVGIVTSWFAFRWYHLPLGESAGWTWSPRSRARAFGIGVGTLGYVEPKTQQPFEDDPEKFAVEQDVAA